MYRMASKTAFGVVASCFVAAVSVACGGAQPASATPDREETASSESAAPAGPEPGAPDVPWPQKTREQRMEYMGLVVYPKMKETFQSFDAKGFAEFKCQTCHGKDMEAVDFKMPNSLYGLSATDPMGAAMEYDEQVAKFMAETVVPTMAELLGTAPYDPATHEGFGCFGCHQMEE